MPVIEMQDVDFKKNLSELPRAVVDYHSGRHAECILLKAALFRIAQDYPDISFVLVDSVDAPITTQTVFLEPMPYFAAFRAGEKVEGISTREERSLRTFIERCFPR